jgi:hypothetical protein
VAERASYFSLEAKALQQVAVWWHEAEKAARSRRVPRARRFLRWILACVPEDEEAWLRLAQLASTQPARLAYLRQAYLFHPESSRVQAALRQARNQLLESAVGDLMTGQASLRCLPDERHLCRRDRPCRSLPRSRALLPRKRWKSADSGLVVDVLPSRS